VGVAKNYYISCGGGGGGGGGSFTVIASSTHHVMHLAALFIVCSHTIILSLLFHP